MSAPLGKRGMGLFEQHAFLRQIPIVQNMAHYKDIGFWQRIREEVARKKFNAFRQVMLRYEFLENRFDFGQVVSGARKMGARAAERHWHHALRGSDINEGLIVLSGEFGGDRVRRAEARPAHGG